MTVCYRKFARWILSDLAERTKTEHRDRVVFEGNHISRQFILPVKDDHETPEGFKQRMVEFRRRLPRDSDLSYRMACAADAFVRAGENAGGPQASYWKS